MLLVNVVVKHLVASEIINSFHPTDPAAPTADKKYIFGQVGMSCPPPTYLNDISASASIVNG